jgi:hypothetical protein
MNSVFTDVIPSSTVRSVSPSYFCYPSLTLISSGARTCPKGLNPAKAIAQIKLDLAAD